VDSLTIAGTILLFIILMALEIPIGFALLGAGLVGIWGLGFGASTLSFMAATPFGTTANYAMLIIPMFLLLGAIVAHSGIATRIFEAANRLLGWLPGGLAVSTILACTMFGAISGSSAADVATIGKVSLKEMRRHGYNARFAAGVIAAGGTLAILIPPSVPMVMYGILTGVPIGPLLIAGIVPGLLTALAFIAYVVGVCWWRGIGVADIKMALPSTSSVGRLRRAMSNPYVGLGYASVLIFTIIGGIYSGIFTSTEAAAFGAFVALLLGVPVSIAEGPGWRGMLGAALVEAGQLTSMVFILLVGSAVFSYFLTLSGVAAAMASWVIALDLSPNQVVALCLLILIPLGMFLDGMSMLLIVVPLMYPLLKQLGVDGIWFGVLTIMLIEIGLLTPPFGINVFVICGIAGDLSLEQAFIGVIPFMVIQFLMVLLIFFFPEIVLFLPSLAGP